MYYFYRRCNYRENIIKKLRITDVELKSLEAVVWGQVSKIRIETRTYSNRGIHEKPHEEY